MTETMIWLSNNCKVLVEVNNQASFCVFVRMAQACSSPFSSSLMRSARSLKRQKNSCCKPSVVRNL